MNNFYCAVELALLDYIWYFNLNGKNLCCPLSSTLSSFPFQEVFLFTFLMPIMLIFNKRCHHFLVKLHN